MIQKIICFLILLSSSLAGLLLYRSLETQELSLNKYHNGKVALVNFWATWCPPCREEIPDFIRLHSELQHQNFTVIGLAIDKEAKIRAFEQEMGVNYPSLIAEKEGYSLMEEYGSLHGALPYTVILDRQGNIAYKHHKGVLSYAEAKRIIEPLL